MKLSIQGGTDSHEGVTVVGDVQGLLALQAALAEALLKNAVKPEGHAAPAFSEAKGFFDEAGEGWGVLFVVAESGKGKTNAN